MTESILFASLFIAVLVASLFCFWMGGVSFRRPAPSTLFVGFYIITAYLGIWLLFFEQNTQAISRGVTDHGVVWIMFGLSAATLLLMSIGFLLLPVPALSAATRDQNSSAPLTFPGYGAALLLFVFCCVVFALYLIAVPEVPLLAALRGDIREANELRQSLMTTNQVRFGKISYFHAVFRMLLPFLGYVFFAHALVRRTKRAWFMAVLVILMASLATIIDTAKGGMMAVVLGCGLTYLLIRQKPITMRVIAATTAIMLPVGYWMIASFMHAGIGVLEAVRSMVDRLLMGNLAPAYHVVDMFRDGGYLLGRTFPNPLGVFPFEPYNLDQVVWLRMHYTVSTLEHVYTAPSVMWAEMYANFAVPGVLVAAPLFGVFLRAVESPLGRVRSAPVRAGLIAFVSLYCVNMVVKGLIAVVSLVFDYYLLGVVAAAAFITGMDRSFERSAVVMPEPEAEAEVVAPPPAPRAPVPSRRRQAAKRVERRPLAAQRAD